MSGHLALVLLVLATLSCATPQAPPKSLPPAAALNVLYVLVDDLRPSLSPYGQTQVYTPNYDKFAASATVFDRAYCNVAVCSPSRNSFLSGLRPHHNRIWNFINHIRQAYCGLEIPGASWDTGHHDSNARLVKTIPIDPNHGQAGECCTQCTDNGACTHWSYSTSNYSCALFAAVSDGDPPRTVDPLSVAGRAGSISTPSLWNKTTLPEHFKDLGYTTAGTGKIFHTEEGGLTPPWNGSGMPPNQDPPSWTAANWSMHDVDATAKMQSCGNAHFCGINATLDGDILDGSLDLCDKIIGDDALLKLRAAAAIRAATGRPFFLAVGFRKPHLPWRFPAPYLDFYPNVSEIDVAAHPTLDLSVPPVAIPTHSLNFQKNPYVAMDRAQAQALRQHYYAAISWHDHQLGKVLDELDALGLRKDTLVVMHADHGWSLGEHGEWHKFTEWEAGTRVPFIVRDPRSPGSHGQRTSALTELVDVLPTIAELAGVPLPASKQRDGTSFAPVLRQLAWSASFGVKNATLSEYPRCPTASNPAEFGKNNICEFVERSQFRIMGISLRTDAWRYTEWRWWQGWALQPDWSDDGIVGIELYNHTQGIDCWRSMNACFDDTENVNLAASLPSTARKLSAELRRLYDEPTRGTI